MSDIAVVILNYNSYKETINEIEHVKGMFDISYNDFIVVDNKSTNESVIQLEEYKKIHNIVLLLSNENGGYAKGNNIGLKHAKENGYKYVLIINNDIEFTDKNTLKEMKNILIDDDSLATINPDIMSPYGNIYNRDSSRPTFFDMTLGMLYYRYKGRKLEIIDNKYGYVYRPQGCCFLADVSKLCDVDYFDEYTFLYNEENILAEKLLIYKYRCACILKHVIIHHTSGVVKNNIDKDSIIKLYLCGYKYYLQHYRKYNRLLIFFALLFLKSKLRFII